MVRFLVVSLVVIAVAGCKSREEQLKAAEDEGNLLVAKKAKLLEGGGEALKKEGKAAAEKLAEGGGEVFKGLGKGFDKSLTEVKLEVVPELAPKGLGATRAARRESGKTNVVTVYVTMEKAYTGPLELRAFDSEDKEVGRAKAEVDAKEGGAQYLDFEFDERTPLLTAGKFVLR